jgi:dicarboxylate/amino acid:cation (Na+ or H+) symporter, DAACS family
VNIVTRNPLKSAVDGDMLGVIFFGIMVGAAITLIAKERAQTATTVLEAVNDIVIKIVEIAMKLAPYGVAALIFTMTSRFGFSLLKPLGMFAGIVIVGLIVQTILLVIFVKMVTGLSPVVLLSRAKAAMITAFSTSSSNATLPTNIATAEQKFGVPPSIAGFVLPLGATMNMNGTALFEGVTVLFLCQVFNVDLSVVQMVVVVGLTVITAIGAAGVPGGSIPLLVGVLAMFGVPPEGIAIVIGIDRLLDMSRTVVNVFGDLTTSLVVAKLQGEWDPSMVPPDVDPVIDESP